MMNRTFDWRNISFILLLTFSLGVISLAFLSVHTAGDPLVRWVMNQN